VDNLFLYWQTVLLYIVCITTSVFFAALAQIYSREAAAAGISSRGRTILPNRFWWFMSMLVPLLLLSLRLDMGTDYVNYLTIYDTVNKIETFQQFIDNFALPNRPLYC
jgi:hypothetical protein